MGFEGYTKYTLQSIIKDLLLNKQYMKDGDSFADNNELEAWGEVRPKEDQETIRKNKISAGDFTDTIRSVVSDYGGVPSKNWSGKEARQAIIDAVYTYRASPTSRNARKLWVVNDSAKKEKTEEIKRYISDNKKQEASESAADLFEVANAIGMYTKIVLKKTQELRDISVGDKPYETRFNLHIEVLDDIKKKVESENLIEKMLTADSKTLISNWNTYFPVLQMATIGEHVKIYAGNPDFEAKKNKLNEYRDILDRIQAVKPEIEARMELLASSYSEKLDVDRLSEMSAKQLNAIQDKMEEKATLHHKNSNGFVEYDPFALALTLNKRRLERQKKEIAERLFGENVKLQISDINGNQGKADELLRSGLPVVISSEQDPDNSRYVYIDGVNVFYGKDAVTRFQEKKSAALKGKPSGFGWLWDKFCSAVGRDDWRTEAAKNYYKFERMLDEHPDIEEKLNNPSEEKLVAALPVHEKKPSREEETGQKENTVQKDQAVKEEKTKQDVQTDKEKKQPEKKEEKPAPKAKVDQKALRKDVKKYLGDQLTHYDNGGITPGNVVTYLLYKSLSDAFEKFENADKSGLSPDEQKAAEEISFILTENYKKEIDGFINARREAVEIDPAYRIHIEELKEIYEDDVYGEKLIAAADEISGIDALKVTVPGKTMDEYTTELYYSINELDKDVREAVEALSDDLRRQGTDLLSKENLSHSDKCRAAIITHIVHEIHDGFDHTSRYIGLDDEFKAVVDLVKAGGDYSEKLNDFIDNRVNVLESAMKFNKLVKGGIPGEQPSTEEMKTDELKSVLAANLKGEVQDNDLKAFFVIQNENKLVKILSSNDISKCAQQHNNLKKAGLSESDRLLMENYTEEINTVLNKEFPNIKRKLEKKVSPSLDERAGYLSYIKISSGVKQALQMLSGIENGETADKEKIEKIRSIEDQIINNKEALEEKRKIIEKALHKSKVLFNIGNKELHDVLCGMEKPSLEKEFNRIMETDAEERAKQAAAAEKKNKTPEPKGDSAEEKNPKEFNKVSLW